MNELARFIRDIPDYPKSGIVFKDITPLLANPAAFAGACDYMAAPFMKDGVSHVVAIESRGFLFGAPIALSLGAGLVPMRKAGKLPHQTTGVSYDLEYGTDRLELHTDALDARSRVVLVDDVLATGGTAAAGCQLIRSLGATVVGCSFLLRLGFLNGLARLAGERVESVLVA
ncbi:MAG TPA: adenine phosphoribosyltransferase [Gemmatimonadaceae bacterium]|nr:adenine phosphoribosyltransferase [Gemmatimonadaceae bacterium]